MAGEVEAEGPDLPNEKSRSRDGGEIDGIVSNTAEVIQREVRASGRTPDAQPSILDSLVDLPDGEGGMGPIELIDISPDRPTESFLTGARLTTRGYRALKQEVGGIESGRTRRQFLKAVFGHALAFVLVNTLPYWDIGRWFRHKRYEQMTEETGRNLATSEWLNLFTDNRSFQAAVMRSLRDFAAGYESLSGGIDKRTNWLSPQVKGPFRNTLDQEMEIVNRVIIPNVLAGDTEAILNQIETSQEVRQEYGNALDRVTGYLGRLGREPVEEDLFNYMLDELKLPKGDVDAVRRALEMYRYQNLEKGDSLRRLLLGVAAGFMLVPVKSSSNVSTISRREFLRMFIGRPNKEELTAHEPTDDGQSPETSG